MSSDPSPAARGGAGLNRRRLNAAARQYGLEVEYRTIHAAKGGEADYAVLIAPRPVRQVGLVLLQLLLRHGRQQSSPELVFADLWIEQHGAEPAVALNDPVDGLTLRLVHVVEAAFDQLPIPVEELPIHTSAR